jgi:hypothetical protein
MGTSLRACSAHYLGVRTGVGCSNDPKKRQPFGLTKSAQHRAPPKNGACTDLRLGITFLQYAVPRKRTV